MLKREPAINGERVLDEIAIININKSGGGATTPHGKLDKEYRRTGVKDFLFKQVEFINPGVIIHGYAVLQFFLDQAGKKEYDEIPFALNNNRLIIWAKHPNRSPVEKYCNEILGIVKKHF